MQPGRSEGRHSGRVLLAEAIDPTGTALAELCPVDPCVANVAREVVSRLAEGSTKLSHDLVIDDGGRMTDEKAQWIADLRAMVEFLEEHPELIGKWEHVMLSVGILSPEKVETILPLLPDTDCTDDPARFFGDHYIYMNKKYTRRGMIKDLQKIAEETA